jgi:phosphate/sulfate permease
MAVLQKYSWIFAITTIAFLASSASNGANDVANSYATSVAARTLKMWQAGILASITEFVGAVALGSRVTGTIKSGIFSLSTFEDAPATLMLAFGCAEVGSATFLTVATIAGMPVSTTQTVVGALAGVGIAAQSPLSWGWKKGSISQIAASWVIAPLIAAAFSAILFMTIKLGVHSRKDPLKWGLRLIPWYLAFTAGVLALFIIDELPNGESLEEMGPKAIGIILGVFFGMLAIAYIFFVPYFTRRLIKGDTRMRAWHIPLGPLLYRENPPIYWPGKGDTVVTDYYGGRNNEHSAHEQAIKGEKGAAVDNKSADSDGNHSPDLEHGGRGLSVPVQHQDVHVAAAKPEPEERWLHPVKHLPFYSPKKIANWTKFILLQGVSRDVVSQKDLADVHARAIVYDNRVEHLWTYAQVASAMMMSIAHGSNDGKHLSLPPRRTSTNSYLSCQRCRSLGWILQHLRDW